MADPTRYVRRAAGPLARRRIGNAALLWAVLLLATEGCARGARAEETAPAKHSAAPDAAPARGAAPAGPVTCSERDTSFWSGRDAGQGRSPESVRPSPVVIRVRNATQAPLFFALTARAQLRFDLYTHHGGQTHRLDLPENQFCPTACPDEGPARERDCRKPAPLAYRLMPAEQRQVRWSGTEQVGAFRSCGGAPAVHCLRTYSTRAGPYTLKVCARTRALGGQPQPSDPNLLLGASLQGEELCRTVALDHPRTANVTVELTR